MATTKSTVLGGSVDRTRTSPPGDAHYGVHLALIRTPWRPQANVSRSPARRTSDQEWVHRSKRPCVALQAQVSASNSDSDT